MHNHLLPLFHFRILVVEIVSEAWIIILTKQALKQFYTLNTNLNNATAYLI